MSDAAQSRRDRGIILRLIRRRKTDGITYPSLERVWDASGLFATANSLRENVEYLAEKGYLRTEQIKEPISGVERWMVFCTAKGIDLLQGNIEPDPGVDTIV